MFRVPVPSQATLLEYRTVACLQLGRGRDCAGLGWYSRLNSLAEILVLFVGAIPPAPAVPAVLGSLLG